MPRLGAGTWQLEGDTAYDAVRDAIEVGYRHIDTAAAYGNEEQVGRAIADSAVPRDELFVTTKVWHEQAARDDVHASVDDSLRKLGLDHVDLVLLHWPAEDVASVEETVSALADEEQRGRVGMYGLSNSPAWHYERAVEAGRVRNNQVEYHVNLDQTELTRLAMQHGGFLTAYAPLASGSDIEGQDVLEKVAAEHGVTWHQVALAWLLTKDGVVAIPRSSSRSHIEANFEATSLELTDEQVAEIDALPKDHRHFDPPFAPAWSE